MAMFNLLKYSKLVLVILIVCLTINLIVSPVEAANGEKIYERNNKIWVENSFFKAGFDLKWGGSLTNLVSNSQEIVNRFDTGREIQSSIYDGNQDYDGCGGCNGPHGWNPVEAGDKYKHGSPLVSKTLSSTSAYIKTQPLEWNPDDKGGGVTKAIKSNIFIEKWIEFVPNQPRTLKIRYKITNFGSDNHYNGTQELPVAYLNSSFNNFVYYDGINPWTSEAIKKIVVTPTSNLPYLYIPERWGSFVNSSNFGLTMFVPSQYPYTNPTAHSGGSSPTSFGTNTFLAFAKYGFLAGRSVEFEVYLIMDTHIKARNTVYQIKNQLGQLPHVFDSWGAVDSPTWNQTISGTADISGWAFDTINISEVQIQIDNQFIGLAQYGLTRPDVAEVYPNAPTQIGYYYALDTKQFTNGLHTLAVATKTTDGKTDNLSTFSINIQN